VAERTPKWLEACKNIDVETDNRLILCLDGGGIRGIMTLQLLKELEDKAGIPCYELFDMVTGTSTGGIIAGLIAAGKRAVEIEQLYEQLVKQVFTKKSILANRFINPPEYTKKYYRAKLKENLGDITIAQVCNNHKLDLMITSKDVAAGEETFFSFFYEGGTNANTYGTVLLRAAMEATMSAPTYFTPLERFVDGGITTYNNPSLAAIIEAVQYGTVYHDNNNKYTIDKLTVFSFGTGCRPQFIKPDKVKNPDGPDAYFWLQWLMTESGDDASDMQCFLFRSKYLPERKYRRFQLSLDKAAILKLEDVDISDIPDVNADRLHDLSDEDLSSIALDDVARFPLMKRIGEQVVKFINDRNNQPKGPFTVGLVDKNGRDLLVSRVGDTGQILKNLSDPTWLDGFDN
jgi:predicted acylesterase/phospholipase RssA